MTFNLTDTYTVVTQWGKNCTREARVSHESLPDIVSDLLKALAGEDQEPSLTLVRGAGAGIGGHTHLAYANAEWMRTEGDFVYDNSSRDVLAWDAIQNSPRTWTHVALTQWLFSSQSLTDCAKAYHALRTLGVEPDSYLVEQDGVEFAWPDTNERVNRHASYAPVSYESAYLRIMHHHADSNRVIR